MPRSRKRLTLFVFLLMVIVALVVSLWQYHQMVVAVYDGASASVYRRMLRPFSSPPDTIGQLPVRIALLQGRHSDGASAVGDGLVGQWRQMLTQHGFGVRPVASLGSTADLSEFNLVVIPGAVRLSDEDIAVIQAFVREGNGVIMSWAAGTRDQAGEWRAPTLLRHVSGMELDMRAPDEETDRRVHVEFDARSPLARGIEPGFVLQLTRFDHPLSARVMEPRTWVAAARVNDDLSLSDLDAGRRPAPMDDRAMLVHGDYLDGRFVWMGFTIASGTPEPEQQAAFQQMIFNAVAWTTRQPITEKPHWPEAIDSAFNLAWLIERAGDVDDRLPALAQAYRIPLTSYVAPDMLRDEGETIRFLAESGPLALLLPAGADGRAGAPPSLTALSAWRQQLADVNRDAPVGCLIGPDAGGDWMDMLAEAGFDYVARSDSAHGLPRLVRTYRHVPVLMRAHELWELPDSPVMPAELGSMSLIRRFDTSHGTGGLLHMSIPAASVDDGLLQELGELFTRIRRRRVWTTNAAEVLAFYRVWGHLRVSSSYPTPNRYVVQVSNTGTRAANDFLVLIRMASPQRALEITPTTLGTPPVHAVSDDGINWRFEIPRIPAGKNFIYHIYRT